MPLTVLALDRVDRQLDHMDLLGQLVHCGFEQSCDPIVLFHGEICDRGRQWAEAPLRPRGAGSGGGAE